MQSLTRRLNRAARLLGAEMLMVRSAIGELLAALDQASLVVAFGIPGTTPVASAKGPAGRQWSASSHSR